MLDSIQINALLSTSLRSSMPFSYLTKKKNIHVTKMPPSATINSFMPFFHLKKKKTSIVTKMPPLYI